MSKRILWVDNDKVFLEPHTLRLEVEGYTVKQAFTLTEGLEEIKSNKYDLLVLDVMMSVREEEMEAFPLSTTNSGRQAGLVFFEGIKQLLTKKGIKVLVFTLREDAAIREKFLRAGLPNQNFMTKSEGADTAAFLTRVKKLLGLLGEEGSHESIRR